MSDGKPETPGNVSGHHEPKVTITVDDHQYEVRPGQWIVQDLKTAVGVDPAKALAEITPHGLVDLDDASSIGVHEGQRFMSHVRSGASS
ncbi:hypothetical protein GWG65_13915 [Bradyrhizobium sp. CSA207]|uniref:hypothetical protein n=1 Tax=Bradyrhizobium sp. CSA207 TaxID=2698826 RepID=UPI0023AEC29D|nr:hypothetical protein [Bradyrhizobium sp. CSA207]MDE5442525.1 hypothetical protein [Bradyrhizobium sp. CSA207]